MSVPLSMKLPPMLKDVSSSVIGRRNVTYYSAGGSIEYGPSNRLLTFNISSEPALLDTDKLYFEFDAVIRKPLVTANATTDGTRAVIPNNSAESFIDRVVLRVGSKVIADTSYGYQTGESMLHWWQSEDFSKSSGNIMGIYNFETTKPLANATYDVDDGISTNDGNNTYVQRAEAYGRVLVNNTAAALEARTLLFEEDINASANNTTIEFTRKFIVPLRMVGFLDQITNLLPLWILDSTISLSVDLYLSSNAQVMCAPVSGALAEPSYVLRNCLMTADIIDVSDDYKNTINSYIANGGVFSIPSSEFNIYQFAVSAQNQQDFQLSAVYKNLEAIYIGFFQNLNSFTHNGEDRLIQPALGSIQLQIGSKYYPSDQPLDCTGSATRAFQQTCKAFNSNGMEAGFSFPAEAYARPIRNFNTGAADFANICETQTFFTIGFPFESVLDEDDSTLTGLDTSQGQGVVTIRLKGVGAAALSACTMVVLCKYKQSVNVGQNYVVDRMF